MELLSCSPSFNETYDLDQFNTFLKYFVKANKSTYNQADEDSWTNKHKTKYTMQIFLKLIDVNRTLILDN